LTSTSWIIFAAIWFVHTIKFCVQFLIMFCKFVFKFLNFIESRVLDILGAGIIFVDLIERICWFRLFFW